MMEYLVCLPCVEDEPASKRMKSETDNDKPYRSCEFGDCIVVFPIIGITFPVKIAGGCNYRSQSMPYDITQYCQEPNCSKLSKYNYFGHYGALYCKLHKRDGMLFKRSFYCQEWGCDNCPSYANPNQWCGTHCKQHKQEGMIFIMKNKRNNCQESNCITLARFNFPGQQTAVYCSQHKQEGMVNVKCKRCQDVGCNKYPSFNFPGQRNAMYCSHHKQEGMVNVVNKHCQEPGCNRCPFFNYSGKKIALYCSHHKQEEMVNVKSNPCREPGCNRCPLFNFSGKKIALYCSHHKQEGMVNIKSKQCQEHGCNTQPSFNLPEKPAAFCARHKTQEMINVTSPQCKLNEGTSIQCTKTGNPYYDGFCYRCFAHLFPDSSRINNFKTKERTIHDFLTSRFPNITWQWDKKIADGCSRRRPDFYADFGFFVMFIEVDEHQHDMYESSCEEARMNALSLDVGTRPILNIRFNPDGYIDEHGKKIPSCFSIQKANGLMTIPKSKQMQWETRLQMLFDEVDAWSKVTEWPFGNDLLYEEYLFYDYNRGEESGVDDEIERDTDEV